MTEDIVAVLAEHGPSGLVNSREGWVECECGARLQLPSGLTFDGYPEMWDEERKARDAHLADALAPLIAVRVEAAKAEALREAAAKVTAGAGDGPVRLVTVRRWLNDRAAALDPGARP